MSALGPPLVALALLGGWASAEDDSGAAGSVWEGLEITTTDGQRLGREELEGRVVLLDFWATWCAPCLAELPTLSEAWSRWGAEEGGGAAPPAPFLLVGVSVDRLERGRLESWLRRHRVSWPQVHDGRAFSGELARRFGVEFVPRSVLVDTRGRIVAVDLRGEVLLTVLRGLLDAPGAFHEHLGQGDPSGPGAAAGALSQ